MQAISKAAHPVVSVGTRHSDRRSATAVAVSELAAFFLMLLGLYCVMFYIEQRTEGATRLTASTYKIECRSKAGKATTAWSAAE